MGIPSSKPRKQRKTPEAPNVSEVPSNIKPLDIHRGKPQVVPKVLPPVQQHSIQKPDYNNVSSFEKDILKFHNKARTENGLPPLVWDKALQAKAGDWAKFLVTKDQDGMCVDPSTGKNRHPGDGINAKPNEQKIFLPHNWGQNIYQSNSVQIPTIGPSIPLDPTSPADAVQQWYSECKDYPNKMEPNGIPVGWDNPTKPIGHFTQAIWKDATKVGCAKYPCKGKIRHNNQMYDSKGQVYVCNYDKGNIGGQFPQQVKWPVKCEGDNTWISS